MSYAALAGVTVPAGCWSTPGFKDCQAEGGHQAYRSCSSQGLVSGGAGWDECYRQEEQKNLAACVSAFCPQKSSSSSSTSSASSSPSTESTLPAMPSRFWRPTTEQVLFGTGTLLLLVGGTILWRNRDQL